MNTKTQILPGIKRIGWLDCRRLTPYVSLQHICGMPVAIMAEVNFIDEFEDASCECATERKGAGLSAVATLKFRTNRAIPNNGFLAFVVTTPGGENFLIGSFEKPHVTLQLTKKAGSPSSDPAGFEYEIKHIGIRSMIPCVIAY